MNPKTPRTDAVVDYTSPEKMHRLCKELEAELAALTAQEALRCVVCNAELSCCGPPDDDGEPSLDCKMCILAGRVKSLEAEIAGHTAQEADAARYRKLRNWMSSNVKEGWSEVESLGAVACYMDWDTFDKHLDDLPECNFGLCNTGTAIRGEDVKCTGK